MHRLLEQEPRRTLVDADALERRDVDEPHRDGSVDPIVQLLDAVVDRGGQKGSYRDNPVDAIAAALLLQGWLDENTALFES